MNASFLVVKDKSFLVFGVVVNVMPVECPRNVTVLKLPPKKQRTGKVFRVSQCVFDCADTSHQKTKQGDVVDNRAEDDVRVDSVEIVWQIISECGANRSALRF